MTSLLHARATDGRKILPRIGILALGPFFFAEGYHPSSRIPTLLLNVKMKAPLLFVAALSIVVAHSTAVRPKFKRPLRVFVMVGQSNMVGHGVISAIDDSTGSEKNATLQWLVDNVPEQFGMLQDDGSGTWTTRKDVLMACNRRDDLLPVMSNYGQYHASLCGGDRGQYQVGPELGFGWAVGDGLNHRRGDKVLLMKIAWGGKSLAEDFRPPSSGGTVGPYYQSMIANVKATLSNITGYFPQEEGRPIKMSGFAWHQGWNDGCDFNMTAEYEYNLANLIRDVRRDLEVPDLPISIGASGMAGYEPGRRADIVAAQMAVSDPNKYPDFDGTVATVDTRPYCRDPYPASPSDLGYHWNNNAESYWLVGKSMGQAMVELVLRREAVGDIMEEKNVLPNINSAVSR